ncbi:MAG: GNAT family N-acetyltransferase, partial [Nocardioides sp.]
MSATVRRLTEDDAAESRRLGTEAFGGPPPNSPAPTGGDFPQPGHHYWGAIDEGRLLARVVAFEFASWFRGATVATSGIAGVAVSAEHRGQGLLDPLFEAVLDEAAGRGEVIST